MDLSPELLEAISKQPIYLVRSHALAEPMYDLQKAAGLYLAAHNDVTRADEKSRAEHYLGQILTHLRGTDAHRDENEAVALMALKECFRDTGEDFYAALNAASSEGFAADHLRAARPQRRDPLTPDGSSHGQTAG